jgi:6-phosphofructokinase 1
VDPHGANFQVARNFMIRLERSDFDDEAWLLKLARNANLSVQEFRARFEHLASDMAG